MTNMLVNAHMYMNFLNIMLIVSDVMGQSGWTASVGPIHIIRPHVNSSMPPPILVRGFNNDQTIEEVESGEDQLENVKAPSTYTKETASDEYNISVMPTTTDNPLMTSQSQITKGNDVAILNLITASSMQLERRGLNTTTAQANTRTLNTSWKHSTDSHNSVEYKSTSFVASTSPQETQNMSTRYDGTSTENQFLNHSIDALFEIDVTQHSETSQSLVANGTSESPLEVMTSHAYTTSTSEMESTKPTMQSAGIAATILSSASTNEPAVFTDEPAASVTTQHPPKLNGDVEIEGDPRTRGDLCKKVLSDLSRPFRRTSYKPGDVMEQEMNVTFTLSGNYDKFPKLEEKWSYSYCKLANIILQASFPSLSNTRGLLRYNDAFVFKTKTVHVRLLVDFKVGPRNKTHSLMTAYADVAAGNMKDFGFEILPTSFVITSENVDVSAVCSMTSCPRGTSCVMVESTNERRGDCVHSCEQENYCLNNGICQLDRNGRNQCWCPSSAVWWFRGDRCEIAENSATIIMIAGGVIGFVLLLMLIIVLCFARKLHNLTNHKTLPWIRRRPKPNVLTNTRFVVEEQQLHHNAMTSHAAIETTRSNEEDTDSLPIQVNWSPLDKTTYKYLRPPQHEVIEMVQATSFRSISSRERAGLNNLHGEANSGTVALE